MSNKKKPKKLRSPNLSGRAAPTTTAGPALARGGGQELTSQTRVASAAATPAGFDYTHVKQDLRRIGVLAGSFIVVLVVLSFFIK